MNEKLKARKFRRILFNIFITLFFVAILTGFAYGAQELLLPVILGGFVGYLFRPLVQFVKGKPLVRYSKALFLLGMIVSVIYVSVTLIKASLPNEKEQLELIVRLQYRINLRYQEWLEIDSETGKGNFIYNYIGDELNPVLDQVNEFLSLDSEQRRLFMLYRKGYMGEEPISDKYYQYFLSDLNIIQSTESEQADLSSVAETEDEQKSSGLGILMKLISVWLVFPLTMIFVMLDRGQLLQFFMKLIPNRYFELTRTVIDKVDDALGHYIRGTILQCSLVGLTIAIGLWLCGFKANVFILVGLVGGLTNAIPFVGPAMAFLVGGGFALIAEDITPILPMINLNNLIIAVMMVVGIAQLMDNAVYQPLVVGRAVNIHPLAVIIGVFGGSLTFGFAGLLLAIPTIVILKVVTETLFQGLKAYKII